MGFQDVLLPLLLAAMLLGFWAFVFYLVVLSGLFHLSMRSGKGKTQFTRVPCAMKREDTKTKFFDSSSTFPLQVIMVRFFYWIATAFFSPSSIEDGRCNVVCAAASVAAIGEVLLFFVFRSAAAVTSAFGQEGASAAAGMQQALAGFLALVGVLAFESAFGEVLLFYFLRSAAALTAWFGQWVASAAAGMQQALDVFFSH